jgi:hypothetical protein
MNTANCKLNWKGKKVFRIPLVLLLALVVACGGFPLAGAVPDAYAEGGDNMIDLSVAPASDTKGEGWMYKSSTAVYTILDGADVTITGDNGTSNQRLVTTPGAVADVTFSGAVTITAISGSPFEIVSGSTVNLTLAQGCDATLKATSLGAGIAVTTGNELRIDGSGSLTVIGGIYGAGIGGGSGDTGGVITIYGGTITATGGSWGAGIGGGRDGAGGTITIYGGTIAANGSVAAGIGGGDGGAGGTITIHDGTITANGGSYSAGIGGGYGGASSTITIDGGTVMATGGYIGAGIGGSGYSGGAGGTVTINGGTVTATGGNQGAGIGGEYGSAGGTLTMDGDGVVFASSVSDASLKESGILFDNARGNDGFFYGDSVAITDDVTIPSGKTLTIPEGSELMIPQGKTLTNEGTLVIDGKLVNEGTFTNNGSVINNGMLVNDGKLIGDGEMTGNGILGISPKIAAASLPNGTVGTAYRGALVATAGSGPITWSIAGGSLPGGLGLDANTGVISGTPTAAGTFSFTIAAANSVGKDTKAHSITIAEKMSQTPGDGETPDGTTPGGLKPGQTLPKPGDSIGGADSGVVAGVLTDKSGESVALVISGLKARAWTGRQAKPVVTVKAGSTTLKSGTDYTVAYGKNKNIGKGTLTITGKGDYSGTNNLTFKIVPKTPIGLKLTAGKQSLTVKWKKLSKAQKVTGYQVQYRYKTGKKWSAWKARTFKVSYKAKAKTVAKVLKKLNAKKGYQVRVRAYKKVDTANYYGAWSKAKSKKVA